MSILAGKRILIVEDEFLIAQMVSEVVVLAGAVVVGPANTKEAGLRLVDMETIDAAVLDINLRGSRSDAIGDELLRRKIPFIIATGYGEQNRFPGIAVLAKPYTPARLISTLEQAVAAQLGRHGEGE